MQVCEILGGSVKQGVIQLVVSVHFRRVSRTCKTKGGAHTVHKIKTINSERERDNTVRLPGLTV